MPFTEHWRITLVEVGDEKACAVYRVTPGTALQVTSAEPFAAVTITPVGALVGANTFGVPAAATSTEIVAVDVEEPSVAVTVNTVALNVVDGVPDSTPVDVLKFKPVGRATEPAIEYVTDPVKFVGVKAVVAVIAVF